MEEVRSAETIKSLTAPFFERGYTFEYTYSKGGDSSCVYIYRFKKGGDCFEWRETSGNYEIHLVVRVRGEYLFPDLYARYPKEKRKFAFKHFFKSATVDEKRAFFAQLLRKELAEHDDFFGIV